MQRCMANSMGLQPQLCARCPALASAASSTSMCKELVRCAHNGINIEWGLSCTWEHHNLDNKVGVYAEPVSATTFCSRNTQSWKFHGAMFTHSI